MRMDLKHSLMGLIFGLVFSANALAENTRYVTDEFEVTVRTGQGTQHRIIKNLKSGAKVEILQEDADSGYSHIKLSDDTDGWVLSRYLIDQPIAKDRLTYTLDQLKKSRVTADELKEQLKTLQNQNESLEKDSSKLGKNKSALEKELETIRRVSADQVAIYEENQKLKSELLTLRREIQTVQQENIVMRDSGARDWFLVGASVCVAGIVLGLFLPNLRFKRKQSWGSL